jgi:DNA-binding LacI/PurR family transcriptional regulator
MVNKNIEFVQNYWKSSFPATCHTPPHLPSWEHSPVKHSPALATKTNQAAHRRIAAGLRKQILGGKFVPGSQLPSTTELAETWRSSTFTVHTALTSLVKEGWIERRNGAGTYIADPKNRFLCAGIYHDLDLGSNEHTSFTRSLHFALLEQFDRLKKDTQIFTDSRPKKEQGTVLPALAEAILHGRIQCLVAPSTNSFNAAALSRLALPTAFLTNPLSDHQIEFDAGTLFRDSARRLKADGCRSIGLISNPVPNLDEKDSLTEFYSVYRRAIQAEGLITQDKWIRQPYQAVFDAEQYGYQEFKSLWKLRQKPDGVIVYPDVVVRGAILAILELGVRRVTRRTKFVFHRNAHLKFLCPFPVIWATTDEEKMAEALVQLILKQFKGEKTSSVLLPYTLRDNKALI